MGCFFFLLFLFLSLSELPRLGSALSFLALGVDPLGEDVRFRKDVGSEGETRRVGVEHLSMGYLLSLAVTRLCWLNQNTRDWNHLWSQRSHLKVHIVQECLSTSRLCQSPSPPKRYMAFFPSLPSLRHLAHAYAPILPWRS